MKMQYIFDLLNMSRRGTIAQLAFGAMLAAIFVGSISIPVILGVNTTGWTARDITMFAILPTIMIAGLLYAFARDSGMV